MRVLHVAATAALLGAASCGTCEPDRIPPPAASASASTATATSPPAPSHVSHNPPPPKLACRVVALDGEVHVETTAIDGGGPPLLLQGLAPPEAWVALGKGARVVAKDPRTTRETTFRGPSRARVCVGFTEESWLASGAFESSVGSGEAPGNEEWVVTPWAVVRYTTAALGVEVKPHEADATLTSGVAFAWQPSSGDAGGTGDGGSASEEGWLRLPMGKTKLGTGHDEPVAATLDRCTALASRAKDLAGQVMTPGGASAATITQQVTTRRLARAACAVATLRVDALPRADAATLLGPLATANAAWSGIPGVAP
ncbi:MAG TPA: hypothetical protein VHS09_10555 [Polyangiaceae bacterium]|nr:hypothetical protein [Polyangiaceae bacterium]